MKTLNSPILALSLLALVLWLGYASYHRQPAKPLTMEQLIEQSIADAEVHDALTTIDIFETADNATDHYIMPKAPRNKAENDAMFHAGVGEEVVLVDKNGRVK